MDRESKKVMIEKEWRVGFKKCKAILRYRDGGLKKRKKKTKNTKKMDK